MISKICEAYHFASDINGNTILYSEADGSITTYSKGTRTSRIPTSSFKKYVKFYPVDDYVFTATDCSGLAVFDREKSKQIYKYENENLHSHSYSNACILASFDDYNIKFYDLKCRYLINSKPCANTQKVGWLDHFVYCYDGGSLRIFDFRDLENAVYKFQDILNFTISGEYCFFIQESDKRKYLVKADPKSSERMYLRKEVQYKRIFALKNQESLVGILNDGIKIESNERIFEIKTEDFIVSGLYFCENYGYLFSENTFLEIKNSFAEFVENKVIKV